MVEKICDFPIFIGFVVIQQALVIIFIALQSMFKLLMLCFMLLKKLNFPCFQNADASFFGLY